MEDRGLVPEEPTDSSAGHEGGGRTSPTAAGGCSVCGPAGSMSEHINGDGSPRRRYVYALGRIVPRLPSLGVEKEFAQATGRAETANLTDRQAFHAVLSDPRNRYLARHSCYVFTIQGLETYIVRPRDPADLTLLVEALSSDHNVVIGVREGLAPAHLCDGLILPVVGFDQIYSFDTREFVQSLPKPDNIDEERFRSAVDELFERVIQISDNAGAADQHRALNYLAVRYPSIYVKTAEAFAAGSSLSAIETRISRLGGGRNIHDVIFSYTNRQTDVTEKFFVRVDVTEQFPFLMTKLSPYFDR